MRNYLYKKCSSFFLTRNYMERMQRKFLRFYPMKEDLAMKKAWNLSLLCWGGSFLGGIILFAWGNLRLLYVIFGIFILLMLQSHIVLGAEEREQRILLNQLLVVLGRIGSEYASNGLVADAILMAADDRDYLIYLQLEKLLEILDEQNREEEISVYIRQAPNVGLGELAMISYIVWQYGDSRWNENSVFLLNLDYIKEEAQEELLEMQKRKTMFAMTIPVCLMPFFFLKPIELWAASLMEGMSRYYEGSYGALTVLLVFLSISICFFIIHYLRFPQISWKTEPSHRGWLFRIGPVRRLYTSFLYRNYSRSLKKMEQLQAAGMGKNIGWFHERQLLFGMIGALSAGLFFGHYYGVLQAFTAALCAMAAGIMFPVFQAVLGTAAAQRQKQKEVIGMETILLLLMHQRRIDVNCMLNYMAQFSNFYRNRLQQLCRVEQGHWEDSFEDVRQEKDSSGFAMLLDGLEACDKVPASRAFSGILQQRAFHRNQQKLSDEKRLADSAALCRMLAFLPTFVTVGLYLMIPFIAEGLSQIRAYSQGLERML